MVYADPDRGRDHNRAPRPACAGYHSAHAAPQSLPRSSIIRRRGVFDTARNKGRRVSSRHFILNFIACEAVVSGETGTVAFLTPKRLGPAAVRNKLRRRMREIYRRELAQPEEKAYLIWIARPPALELGIEDLKQAMRELRGRVR